MSEETRIGARASRSPSARHGPASSRDPRATGSRLAALLDARLPGPAADRLPAVAIPMAQNPEIIGCIGEAIAGGLARFVLIGPVDEIRRTADAAGVSLGDAELEHETDPMVACARAARLASERGVDVLMKGLVQTSDFVRAIIARELGLVGPGGLLSHVALCDVDGFDRLFLLTDAAITTNPDAAAKRRLVENAVGCARALGLERPRVAMVAPVERVSAKVPSTVDAEEVVRACRGDDRLEIDGPFGLDVAISPEAAAIKGIDSPVAGRADILVLPNLDAANVLYKSLTGFARADVAGIVAGATVPVVLTSRADSERSKLDSLRFALAVAG